MIAILCPSSGPCANNTQQSHSHQCALQMRMQRAPFVSAFVVLIRTAERRERERGALRLESAYACASGFRVKKWWISFSDGDNNSTTSPPANGRSRWIIHQLFPRRGGEKVCETCQKDRNKRTHIPLLSMCLWHCCCCCCCCYKERRGSQTYLTCCTGFRSYQHPVPCRSDRPTSSLSLSLFYQHRAK